MFYYLKRNNNLWITQHPTQTDDVTDSLSDDKYRFFSWGISFRTSGECYAIAATGSSAFAGNCITEVGKAGIYKREMYLPCRSKKNWLYLFNFCFLYVLCQAKNLIRVYSAENAYNRLLKIPTVVIKFSMANNLIGIWIKCGTY